VTRKVQLSRVSYRGTDPAWSTGHFSVKYWPGGRRAGSNPASATFFSALERNTLSSLRAMQIVTPRAARRARAYVRVQGPDAVDYLNRMLSNDVPDGGSVDALLLTPKAKVIAPVLVWRRGADDVLLLTEPELGEVLRTQLTRMRFAAKCEIEAEEHTSTIVFDGGEGIPNHDYGVAAVEVLDASIDADDEAVLEPLRIEAATPRFGREIDDRVLPAEAGLDERAISFTKGCYPGQEPIARLRFRGHANRTLRVLDVESAEPGAEVRHGDRVVGRVTSAVPGVALAYVRTDVPDDAELDVAGAAARLH
jgi:folate-binding protein YgfZ